MYFTNKVNLVHKQYKPNVKILTSLYLKKKVLFDMDILSNVDTSVSKRRDSAFFNLKKQNEVK